MKKFLFVIALLVLVACNQDIKPGEYIVIPLNQTVTSEVIHYSDSSGEYTIYYGLTPTPTGHPTVAPTGSFPTPTPEIPSTPFPTIVATTIPKPTETPNRCWATVTANSLNIRETPGGNIISTAKLGDTLALEGRQIVNTVVWYQISLSTTQVGWVSGAWVTTPTGNCPF